MRLYSVCRIGTCGWDEYLGFVIRATSEESARYMASQSAADEGRAVWLDPEKTRCEVVPELGEEGIVLASFQAG